MIFLLLFLSTFSLIQANNNSPLQSPKPHILQVYGDVHKDQRFFEEIFPLIIDNFGGYVAIQYSLLGSGVYAVPQMCALSQLGGNVFLQAEYLKCEASGANSPEYCLCLIDIEPKAYRHCVYTKGWLARDSYNRLVFNKHADDETPIVDTASWSLTGSNNAADYFEKICGLFTQNKPYTCNQPLSDNMHRGAVRFDCNNIDTSGLSMSMTSKGNVTKPSHKLKFETAKKTVKKNIEEDAKKEDHETKQDSKKQDTEIEDPKSKQETEKEENETKQDEIVDKKRKKVMRKRNLNWS